MSDYVLLILKKNHKQLRNKIQELNLKQKGHLIKMTVHYLITNKLDDLNGFLTLYNILHNDNIYYPLHNISYALNNLEGDKFPCCKKLLINLKEISIMYTKLLNLMKLFKIADGTINKYFKKDFTIDEFVGHIFFCIDPIIDACYDTSYIKIVRSIILNNKTEMFETHGKNILNKINLLITNFGNNIMKKFGIIFISKNEYNTYSLEEKLEYYTQICESLKNSITDIKTTHNRLSKTKYLVQKSAEELYEQLFYNFYELLDLNSLTEESDIISTEDSMSSQNCDTPCNSLDKILNDF